MDVGAAFGLVGALFGLVGVLVAALVVARSTAARATIDLQGENIEALEKRVELLELDLGRARVAVLQLQRDKDVLSEQVKSVPAFAQMAETMTAEFANITRALAQVAADQRKCLIHIAELADRGHA